MFPILTHQLNTVNVECLDLTLRTGCPTPEAAYGARIGGGNGLAGARPSMEGGADEGARHGPEPPGRPLLTPVPPRSEVTNRPMNHG